MIAFALFIGITAGLRALAPIAIVSWAAQFGWLQLEGTRLAFLAAKVTAYIVSALALGELVTDKLPKTPSRKVPIQFGTRVLSGALCGAAFGAPSGATVLGLVLGAIGAVIGTLGGAAARARLAQAFGNDLPAALLEDVVAVGGAILLVSRFA
jgi:uncharacterized membrane protein